MLASREERHYWILAAVPVHVQDLEPRLGFRNLEPTEDEGYAAESYRQPRASWQRLLRLNPLSVIRLSAKCKRRKEDADRSMAPRTMR
mmetsp:Transcript_10216/g.34080  ORF Transcript_10216/g.34080 Transcript_10216/m.34080 type:complete len:88 (-) Transcript_10216:1646-1909(-)